MEATAVLWIFFGVGMPAAPLLYMFGPGAIKEIMTGKVEGEDLGSPMPVPLLLPNRRPTPASARGKVLSAAPFGFGVCHACALAVGRTWQSVDGEADGHKPQPGPEHLVLRR